MSKDKGKLLKPDVVKSVFTLKIYYNKNHIKTGTQMEWRFHSWDFESERKSKSHEPKDYNGYEYLTKLARKIYNSGEMWYAILSWNRILDEQNKNADGKPMNLIIWEFQAKGVEKKFLTSEEQRLYMVEQNMRKMAEEEAAMQVHGGGYSYGEFV